jgi:microcystin-dependent protein
MSDPFIAEIRIFAGNFAPRGWALCDGQLLQISQNTALFSLLGTIYGGDGRTTFGVPNLKGRAVMHPGNGPGLSPRQLGAVGGTETEALAVNQIPSHTHAVNAVNNPATAFAAAADGSSVLARSVGGAAYHTTTNTQLAADALAATGGGQPHNNLQPYLVLNYIIALVGTFPSRN